MKKMPHHKILKYAIQLQELELGLEKATEKKTKFSLQKKIESIIDEICMNYDQDSFYAVDAKVNELMHNQNK